MRYHRRIFERNRLTAIATVLAMALAAVATACGERAGGGAPAGTDAGVATSEPLDHLALPDGVDVFVEFPRYLHAARRIEVGFDNTSSTAITVSELTLHSPLFDSVAAEGRTTEVEAGRRRDLPIGLGAVVCPAPPGPTLVEMSVVIDGRRHHGVVEVDAELLARIGAQECGAAYVREQVVIGYTPQFTVTDGVVDATIELTRSGGDEPIAVVAVRGSVLLELVATTPEPPLAAIDPTGRGATLPVRIRVIRCDPHAVTESKKTFDLAIWVAVADGESHRIVVAPDGELRAALEQLIDECLRAGSS